ncbi:hypothetical protein CKAH01_04205 [Colletotrichum kahawae]|uniref:Uncharacterized protein n=1 Tax=Colletotrichum kahawae TaxID=34407 RepID=A0AAD9YMS8_COLKA|nr:hypothetical protein CKAH01_04205 [Colletotrichum kahawae]
MRFGSRDGRKGGIYGLEQGGGVVWERCRMDSPQFLRAVSVTRREENHAGGKAGCLRCENQFPIPSGHSGPTYTMTASGAVANQRPRCRHPIFPIPTGGGVARLAPASALSQGSRLLRSHWAQWAGIAHSGSGAGMELRYL